MSIFYLDLELGNDANDGSTWANAWKTFNSGATAARIAPGDIIRVAKSPAPVSIGSATWTRGPIPATFSPSSSTNATPIVVTSNAHGLVNGDVVQIVGHLTNTNANGVWIVANKTTNTFELEGSVGNGVGTSSGTIRKVNYKTVLLAAALTKTIDTCDAAWTAAAGGDTTVSLTATCKSGTNGVVLTLDSAVQTSKLQAYMALGSAKDFSAYQEISFWIRNSAAILATHYVITLCSDAAGATPVDTFTVPAIPSTATNLPIVLARNGGGNLGASIQSIAISTGTVAPTASSNIMIDNFEATTTNGLNHQALITKNSLETGGAEGYYPIQSIKGRLVLLDNIVATLPTAGQGYYGITETVTTYIRKTTKVGIPAAFGASLHGTVQDSGTVAGGDIQFQGGYNTSTSTQDGETIIDGWNGVGYGIYINNTSLGFLTLGRFSFCRFQSGYYVGYYVTSVTISSLQSASACTNGILLVQYPSNIKATIANALNGTDGVNLQTVNGCEIRVANSAGHTNSGATTAAGTGSTYAHVYLGTVYGNGYGLMITGGGRVVVHDAVVNYSASAGLYCSYGGWGYLENCTVNDATEMAALVYYAGVTYSTKHDGVVGNNWIWMYGGTWNSLASDRPSADAGEQMWKCITSSPNRDSLYPLPLTVMKLACPANEARTVTAWMKKDHATNIGVKLVCRGGQIAGVAANVVATKANDTNWENLSITFTPTEAGVVEIEAQVYYVAGNSNAYIGKVGRT